MGLYGGTGADACSAASMATFFDAHPDRAAAWARAQGIEPSDIRSFLQSLTPVVLRTDTAVTNHGFRDGRANAYQAVLQAGTAVMVDEYGVPRVRCACGNPLDVPEARDEVRYTGETWSELGTDPSRSSNPHRSSSSTSSSWVQQDTTVVVERLPGTDGDHDAPAAPEVVEAALEFSGEDPANAESGEEPARTGRPGPATRRRPADPWGRVRSLRRTRHRVREEPRTDGSTGTGDQAATDGSIGPGREPATDGSTGPGRSPARTGPPGAVTRLRLTGPPARGRSRPPTDPPGRVTRLPPTGPRAPATRGPRTDPWVRVEPAARRVRRHGGGAGHRRVRRPVGLGRHPPARGRPAATGPPGPVTRLPDGSAGTGEEPAADESAGTGEEAATAGSTGTGARGPRTGLPARGGAGHRRVHRDRRGAGCRRVRRVG